MRVCANTQVRSLAARRERASGRLRLMSDSEFLRWPRCGSDDFWRNLAAIFSNSLLHTALDFANGIAEATNPKEEPIADEVGRAEA